MLSPTIYHSIKNEIKDTLSVSIPLVSSQLVYALSGFVGTAMIASLGEDALAASVLVSTIWMTLLVLFFGILNAVSILVSHQFGARNHSAISEIMGQAYLLGIFTAIIMIAILFLMPLLLRLSSQPPEVLNLAYDYLYALMWTTPGLVVLIISEQFLAGINRAKLVLRISLLVVPIEISLIYILVFGKFGLPAFGVAGIGYGFAITFTLTSICLLLYLSKSKYYRDFKIFYGMAKINFKYFKELLNMGLPMGFMHVIEVSTFALVTFWISQFSTTQLAAHQIVLQYATFAITLVFAVSQAVTVRVGHAVGRQDRTGVYYASYVGMFLNFFCILLVVFTFYFMPNFILRFDLEVNDPENAKLIFEASALLAINCVALVFDNFRIIGFGALRGLKDTRFPMIASFLSFWVIGLSAAYFFSFTLGGQVEGAWWGLSLGIAVGAVIVLLRLHRLLKTVDLSQLVK